MEAIVAAGVADGFFGVIANSDGGDREVTLTFVSPADTIVACDETHARDAVVSMTVDPTASGVHRTTDDTRGVASVSWPCTAGDEFVLIIFDAFGGTGNITGNTGYPHGVEDGITCGEDGVASMAADGVFSTDENAVGTPFAEYMSPGNPASAPNYYNWLVYLKSEASTPLVPGPVDMGEDGLSWDVVAFAEEHKLGTPVGHAYSLHGARCLDGNFHSRMPLVRTPARLKLLPCV
jgi:hypothetical protein